MSKQVIPIGPRVLVKRDDVETKTPTGIVLPDQIQNPSTYGTIVAVGDQSSLQPSNNPVITQMLGVGDRIMFATYAGTEVKVDDQTLLLMNVSDVLALIKET